MHLETFCECEIEFTLEPAQSMVDALHMGNHGIPVIYSVVACVRAILAALKSILDTLPEVLVLLVVVPHGI